MLAGLCAIRRVRRLRRSGPTAWAMILPPRAAGSLEKAAGPGPDGRQPVHSARVASFFEPGHDVLVDVVRRLGPVHGEHPLPAA